MKKFTSETGIAAPLMRNNVDTDAIIAARSMEGGVRALGPLVFTNWRYDLEGNERPDFILNQPRYRGASLLVAGRNFGCGSSRESAVWALMDYGIRAVIAPSYGDIFYENSLQNGLLPIRLDEALVERIAAHLDGANAPQLTVDLETCTISAPGLDPIAFQTDPERRRALLHAKGDFDLLVEQLPVIAAFEHDQAGLDHLDAAVDLPAPVADGETHNAVPVQP
ncbi:3-isopropylmalate dehydratase small subunit [Blastomonas fulva]|uniref:3-isopropylmalate dehydratase small subunit n=1 Tax=Blastomonas fulva TaxID=1550728 RepID=UPI003F7199E5